MYLISFKQILGIIKLEIRKKNLKNYNFHFAFHYLPSVHNSNLSTTTSILRCQCFSSQQETELDIAQSQAIEKLIGRFELTKITDEWSNIFNHNLDIIS